MKGSLSVVFLALSVCAAGAVAEETRALQISHAIQSGSDHVPYPTNDAELDNFFGSLSRKYGSENFRAAMHQTYQHEQRNDDWAPRVEEQIAAAAAQHQNEGIVVNGQCRTSICAIDVKAPEGKSAMGAAKPFAGTLVGLLRNAQIPVVVTGHTVENQTDTLYIYSVAPPEHYADDLLARLRKSPS